MTALAGIFINLLGQWLGARRGAFAAGIALAVYTVFVGVAAAVVRAAIMGGLTLLARRLRRTQDAMATLAASAFLMTSVNPLTLWDVGFQLSFAATLGLVLYAEPFKGWFIRAASARLNAALAKRLAEPVSEFFLFTLAAQATTLPVTLYYFQRLSLVSLIANPAILPLQPPLMVLGGLATLLGFIWLPLGRPLAWITWTFAALTIRLVKFFARLPLASIALGSVGLPVIIAYYLLLFGGTVVGSRRKILPRLPLPRLSTGLLLAGLALLAALLWRHAVDLPDGRLRLNILDVGARDAALIESPTGRSVLIDGGPSPVALAEGLGRRLPLLDRGIDWVIVAGTKGEQVSGLAGVAERFPIGALLLAGPPGQREYRQLLEEVTGAGRPIVRAEVGMELKLGGGATLRVAALGDHGAILLLAHGRTRVLLAPGSDPALASELTRSSAFESVTAALLADGATWPRTRPSGSPSSAPGRRSFPWRPGTGAGCPPMKCWRP